MNALRELGMV